MLCILTRGESFTSANHVIYYNSLDFLKKLEIGVKSSNKYVHSKAGRPTSSNITAKR